MSLKLMIGLGNPGAEYAKTRHNAGAWFVETFAHQNHCEFKHEKKLHTFLTSWQEKSEKTYLAIPSVFMNQSGMTAQLISQYYQIKPTEIMIVHDELDLPVGTIKLKQGGGHGGHNGIRDIIQKLGNPSFYRLRIGIGHPKQRELVHHYVLNPPSQPDKILIDDAISRGIATLPMLFKGEWSKGMQWLHTQQNNDLTKES